jgi:hypothetical protein
MPCGFTGAVRTVARRAVAQHRHADGHGAHAGQRGGVADAADDGSAGAQDLGVARGLDDLDPGPVERLSRAQELETVEVEQDDGEPVRLACEHASRFGVERREVRSVKIHGAGQRLQDPNGSGDVALEKVDQPRRPSFRLGLDRSALLSDHVDDERRGDHHHGQGGGQEQGGQAEAVALHVLFARHHPPAGCRRLSRRRFRLPGR